MVIVSITGNKRMKVRNNETVGLALLSLPMRLLHSRRTLKLLLMRIYNPELFTEPK
jgi:hypothetical protein